MEVGDVVRSLRGRDKGRCFLVVGESVGRVLVADGDLRPVKKPKAKNPKHVGHVGQVGESERERLRHGPVPGDADVRRWLQDLQEGGDADAEG